MYKKPARNRGFLFRTEKHVYEENIKVKNQNRHYYKRFKYFNVKGNNL